MAAGLLQPEKPFEQLPKRKRDFVLYYIECGNEREAYAKAGYKSASTRSLASLSRKLLKEMQPYINLKFDEHIKSTKVAIMGLSRVMDLAENAESEVVRLNAAKELLQRSIPEGPREVHHHHTKANESDEDLLKRLKKLQDKLFIDAPPAEVVGTHLEVIK